MENFKNIYFTALDKQREEGNVITNKDVKDCLDYAVNQEFWNMSESFQNSLANLLMKEYREHTNAKEELKQKRLKSLEKARLVKALKRAELVKGQQQEEQQEQQEDNKELLKQIDLAMQVIQNKQKNFKKKALKDGIDYSELIQVNGKTYRILEEV